MLAFTFGVGLFGLMAVLVLASLRLARTALMLEEQRTLAEVA